MKIFLTGGAGFIGSNFILNYINQHKILNYDKLTYAGNLDNLNSLKNHENYNFIKGDIQDFDQLRNAIFSFKPDIIINFAAESHVDRSIDGPKEFIKTNILGTYELLQCAFDFFKNLDSVNKNNFKLLHVSTDEVYGSLKKEGRFSETTAYNPSSPYSASKASSDHLVKAWYKTFGLPILITNCSNNYGPYQFPEKLIPLIITNCLEKKELPIYGDGLNIRDWIYVKDHCKAIFRIIQKGKIVHTYNIGGNCELTNLELVTKICSIMDKKKPLGNGKFYKELINFVKDRPGHDFRYAIDSSKLEKELDFKIDETISTGLSKTISWYLDNIDWINNIKNKKYNQERLGNI